METKDQVNTGQQKTQAMKEYVSADALFLYAERLLEENKAAEAKDVLISLINEDPDYGRAHNHLGWIYKTKFNDYSSAERHYKLALKYAPGYPATYINYSDLLLHVESVDRMLELFPNALKVPGIDKAYLYRMCAIAYEIKGQYKNAMKQIKLSRKNGYNSEWLDILDEDIKRLRRKASAASRFAMAFL